MEDVNPVGLAVADMRVVAGVLRGRTVKALDIRDLSGYRRADSHSDGAVDIYLGAVDAALDRLPGLRNRGYKIERVLP